MRSLLSLPVLTVALAVLPAVGSGLADPAIPQPAASQLAASRLAASQLADANQNLDATKAYENANMKMHAAMNMQFTGDPDVDFVQSMIPHHQGAVEMAKVVMTYGKDPEVRKLAADILKNQEQEIAWMKQWLKQHGQ